MTWLLHQNVVFLALLAGLMGAIGLAIGIGLQNVPEGAALSIPIRADGKSRIKAFYWGSMSAIVEPIGAVMGAALVYVDDGDYSLCFGFCGWCHDLCGNGGIDS